MNEMTNDELRVAIAKAKGMNPSRVEEWTDIYGGVHDSDYAGDREWYPVGTPIHYAKNGVFYPLPDWPTDIAAAWELFDELPIHKGIVTAPNGSLICYCDGEDTYMGVDYKFRAYDKTVPVAICLCWLAWKAAQE